MIDCTCNYVTYMFLTRPLHVSRITHLIKSDFRISISVGSVGSAAQKKLPPTPPPFDFLLTAWRMMPWIWCRFVSVMNRFKVS